MKTYNMIKRILDVVMTVTLLLLMAFQVTQQLAHEWLGVAMFALTILHQVLNRKYYAAIFKGRYNLLRIFRLIVNILLLVTFVCTALSGMMMSRFATPFMNGILKPSFIRQAHLALSHWSFVLMGIHLGLHFGIVASRLKKRAVRIALVVVMSGISVYGFYLFFKAGFLDYMLLKVPFAFFDFSKPWWLVVLENLAMLLSWGFAAYLLSLLFKRLSRNHSGDRPKK